MFIRIFRCLGRNSQLNHQSTDLAWQLRWFNSILRVYSTIRG
ncbi:hypothetical protein YpMG051020_0755 [Yersinia pestis biovar Orientalis str. MG05-1020]|nr:hypothetical protein YpE1979001_2428 [Yersinia pestis biovar Antiqua str. E1979001]EDR58606.1 hypothetical protein YpMG051020_0755 [Yersinia pestis biovar Orientalis str. MG05-1020]